MARRGSISVVRALGGRPSPGFLTRANLWPHMMQRCTAPPSNSEQAGQNQELWRLLLLAISARWRSPVSLRAHNVSADESLSASVQSTVRKVSPHLERPTLNA